MSDPAQSYICPNCSQAVEVPTVEETGEWTCPHCGGTFVVAAPQAEQESRDDELDGVRIRQLSQARRSAYRSRSFCLIGALFCAVGVVQLTINIVLSVARGQNDWTSGLYVILDAAMLWGLFHLLGKARQLSAEARRSSLPPPDKPPDFSTLRDGSQRWKDLENL